MQRIPCKILALSIFIVLVTMGYLARRRLSSTDIVEVEDVNYGYVDANPDESSLWSSDLMANPPAAMEPLNLKQPGDFFGVMFDAGSTGSRVHVFHFQESLPGIPPVLLSEVFNFTKLPLAQYADSPEEGAASLKGLLDVALESIPPRHWASTPVALKATAGLRLIPQHKAQALLDAVYGLLRASPLHVEPQESSVSIMEGTDEGIFMWVTVNFLNDALVNDVPETIGTLDMGGGSTQVTFLPDREETLYHPLHRNYIREHPFLRHKYQLYTRSFLSLGLRAARLEILKREKENPIFLGSSMVGESVRDEYSTTCLPPRKAGSWELGGITYTATSSNQHSDHLYDNCLSVVKAFIEDTVIAPVEIQNRTFYALSYFWERMAEINYIDWKEGGTLLVKDYKQAAIRICRNHTAYADKPFHCMDMVFLSTVLAHGYQFSDDVQLIMTNQIRGFEVSWALGATLDLLRTHWVHTKRL